MIWWIVAIAILITFAVVCLLVNYDYRKNRREDKWPW